MLTIVVALLVGAIVARGLHRSAPHVAETALLPTAHAAPPAASWTPAQSAAMRAELRSAFAGATAGSVAYSLVVIDAAGRIIFDERGSHAVVPASVQKLIVAYTSLNMLGPTYRFHTIAAAGHSLVPGGTLEGNLWIVGSGDPSLRSTDLRSGMDALAHQGLHHISGGVAVDPTAMHGPEINANWNAGDANEDFQTAISAVSLDGDTAEFRIYGQAPGTPARAAIVPESDALHTSGTVLTSSGSDDVIIAAMAAPNTFRFSGTIPPYTEEKFWLPVHNMPHYVGSVVERMLRSEGITVGAAPSVQAAPIDSVMLWDHRSAPLATLEKFMLFVSDNHYA
ncbi:MAG: D-alanyl-D-alanine carboxypeptidase/D-alanyl-D-alanine-endopeptidase, partial [Candidatus Eremiobacteraeota bacterium]|nr:D-alanyl-D-alanine carboxypeptidase/D-alanyl-D-alanine-endopeptidase [Candidatus Eremiobacteraeota bacterium]